MDRRLLGTALVLTALASASCEQRKRERPMVPPPGAAFQAPPGTRVEVPAPSSSAGAPLASAAPTGTSSARLPEGTAAALAPPLAAGDVCHITRGPVQVPFHGQATLWIDDAAPDHDMRVVYNAGGVPRAVALPSSPPPRSAPSATAAKSAKGVDVKKPPERLALSEPAERVMLPPCAFGAGRWFCIDGAGAIHRTATLGQEGAVVAQARSGSPVAAAVIAGSHVAYAFLADRKTTEGAVTLAFVGLDDSPPVLLSEDGAGATFVTLVPRGDEVVAVYVDARRVLTPVHARVLNGNGGARLTLGPDAVLFVGSGTDARMSVVIAQGNPGSELGLLAIDRDDKDFGMAAIRIEEQPRDDAPVTWSIYPAALDRPPLAATQGTVPVRVLRARPGSADPQARKVLELGELSATGAYKPSCPVAEGLRFADPTIAVDRQGAVWLAYTDVDGTWVERRGR